jgi:hypothetical protein
MSLPALKAAMMMPVHTIQASDTEYDSALWGGGLALHESQDKGGLDYSLEYQFRLGDDMSSLSNHFVEFMGYHKASEKLLLNGGYRFTRRNDHDESRLYLGGFLDLTKTERGPAAESDQFRATLQVGYQRDFNTTFDDESVDSNSIRWIVVASKPTFGKVRPFLIAGLLTTWNEVYSFGVDKIRLGGGVQIPLSKRSRLRVQYIWEEFRFREPKKRTNILWLRYEMRFGR